MLLTVAAVLLTLRLVTCNSNATVQSAPLALKPTGLFEGDDGSWSTFALQVGTPERTLRLLPGTSASAGSVIWVVLEEGCSEANPTLSNCSNARGNVFVRNQSSTWSTERLANNGLYQLNTFEEGLLGLTGNAYYGFDTVSLITETSTGSDTPTLDDQLIAGFATNNYWLGSLPLSPLNFNISNFNDPIPSLLGRLRNESLVPSSTWGYTAGAYYNETPGSVTLGGYDKARFSNNTILSDVPFGQDLSRDLVVQLQSITYDTIGSSALLTESVYIFLDSMVSHLWLPVNVCEEFEAAFNLTWNATMELYLVDEFVHNKLLAQNPTFTFTLASTGSGSETVGIRLPYAAFDLNVTQPIADQQMRYFPLKQAQNSSQYTLGRTFLQEAYVIADYDRSNFSVAQATDSTSSHIEAIEPPGFTTTTTQQKRHGLSSGAIAGIVVGVIVFVALLLIVALFVLKRRRRAQAESADGPPLKSKDDEKTGLEQDSPLLFQKLDPPRHDSTRYEVDGRNEVRPEMDGHGRQRNELGSGDVCIGRYELESHEVPAAELDTSEQK